MNKYQRLFKELQKEKEFSPSHHDDHIMLIDGLNTFIRAFGATPSTNEDGDHIGGITGFLFSIGKVVRDFKPTRCIIVFDGRGGSKRRREIYKDYKANRANKTRLRRHDHQNYGTIEDEQEAMRFQFSRLVSYLDNLPVTFISIDGIEADDTIAYIADMYKEKSKKITIVSTDRDFYQMVDDTVSVWSPIKKKMYDTEMVMEEFGVHPANYVVYRTFTGDKSDNIPGVNGFGPATILKTVPELRESTEFTVDDLINKCTTFLTENKKYQKILDHQDIIEKNYQLMNLRLFNISATHMSNIRNIIEGPIPTLNRAEFQKLFMQDKMWTTMKNLPDWLTNTWLSLNAFAQQSNK